jgi:hypothetical protein
LLASVLDFHYWRGLETNPPYQCRRA